MRDRRGALVGLAVGLLLLAAVVFFAVILPRVDAAPAGSDAAASSEDPVALPDTLTFGLVAQDTGRLPTPPGAQAAEFQEQLQDFQTNAVQGYDDLYGVGAAFRIYASEDGSRQALVTVLDKEPGLFAPDGPPVDPEVAGVARPATQLVREGDAICAINWGQPVATGQAVPEGDPVLARCQLGAGGRTWEMAASGMPAADIVATLDALAARG